MLSLTAMASSPTTEKNLSKGRIGQNLQTFPNPQTSLRCLWFWQIIQHHPTVFVEIFLGHPAQVRQDALKLLERLGWHGDLTLLPAFLDEHQRRLLALARCLILKPVVLFVDEPFRMSDVSGWRHFGAVFEGLRRDDALAVLMVTHNLPFVREVDARVLFCGPQGPRMFAHWREFAQDADPVIAGFLAESSFSAATAV